MARLFDIDFSGARVVNRDFEGAMFGPDQRQFKVVIEDQDVLQNLIKQGAPIWCPDRRDEDDLPVGYLAVKVSYRYGAPMIALITPEGKAFKFDEKNVHELDKAWIKDVEMHVHGSSWERPNGQKGVTVYLDTFVAHLISKEERDELMADNQYRNDPIRNKYKNIFGE